MKAIKFVKHNDKRYHSVWDQVKTKVIQVEHIETKLQLAIFLIKAISTKKFQFLMAKSYIGKFMSIGVVLMQPTLFRVDDTTSSFLFFQQKFIP